jgi:hypothetical protein
MLLFLPNMLSQKHIDERERNTETDEEAQNSEGEMGLIEATKHSQSEADQDLKRDYGNGSPVFCTIRRRDLLLLLIAVFSLGLNLGGLLMLIISALRH